MTGHDSFLRVVRSEWTKLRTVRGWIAGLVVAALITVMLGLLTAVGSHTSCSDGDNEQACTAPVGPNGDQVSDNFYFVHQPLDGDGSITVRISSLTGRIPSGDAGPGELRSGLVPWAKAGLIVKDSTALGSTYAAIMVTGDHGVRMQHDYVHDTAGPAGTVSDSSPRWLRLTRAGDLLTGETSTDGSDWSTVGTVRLDELGATVQAGLFVTSPDYTTIEQRPFALSESGGPSQTTGVFDEVDLQGSWSGDDAWQGDNLGDGSPLTASLVGHDESGGTFTIRGTGDIAPAVGGRASDTIEQTLVGTFAGLIAVVIVAAMFITGEYRRGLIHTTLAAHPRRGQVLAAKALVLGGATFTVGLAASIIATTLGERNPLSTATEIRVVVGTAALFAVTAVLALALGTVLRRSAGAVTGVITVMILPYILATASVLPTGPSQWLLRLTPAAAFSIQQSVREYPQVDTLYAPANGYFPLTPWVGFAVLCAYTAAALALAVTLLRRRDA